MDLTAEPAELVLGTEQRVEFSFAEPVFPDDADLDDVHILLYDRSDRSVLGDSNYDEVFTNLEKLSESSLAVDVSLPDAGEVGAYRFSVSYNVGGECDVASGLVDVAVE